MEVFDTTTDPVGTLLAVEKAARDISREEHVDLSTQAWLASLVEMLASALRQSGVYNS